MTEDEVGLGTAIDLIQVLNFAHRGWCDTGIVPLDSGVQLVASFGLNPMDVTELFDLGLHPNDIVELIDEGRDLKEIQAGDFNEDELLRNLGLNKPEN